MKQTITIKNLVSLNKAGKNNYFKLFVNNYDELLEREQQVLQLRFGMIDGKYYTFEEVGQALGVTRERIRQIENKILNRSLLMNIGNMIEFLNNKYTVKIVQWNDEYKYWRVGLNWFSENDYLYIVEKQELRDALWAACAKVLNEDI